MRGFALALCAVGAGVIGLNLSKGQWQLPEWTGVSTPFGSYEPWVERRLDLLAGRTREPESAEFKDVFTTQNGDVCGLINSKNEYGGYTGFQKFVIYDDNKGAVRITIYEEGVDAFAMLAYGEIKDRCGSMMPSV